MASASQTRRVVNRVIVLPQVFSREKLRIVNRRSRIASASQTHFRFSEFSFSRERLKVVIRVIALPPFLLKGKSEGGNWAIAHGECFANALPLVFSRERLKVVNRRSRIASASQMHWSNCHAIATHVPKPQVKN